MNAMMCVLPEDLFLQVLKYQESVDEKLAKGHSIIDAIFLNI